MKGIGWIIGGVLLLAGKKSAPANTGSQQLGHYATPPLPRAGSTASRSQASKSSPSSGGGGGAPGTQAAGKSFWNALENFFTGSSTNKIDTSTSPDPDVPDFWATPGTPQGGTTDALGDVIGTLFPDQGDPGVIFDPTQSVTYNDQGLIVDPDTGIPIGADNGVTTPGGFFPDQFGPDIPPDQGVDPGTDFSDPGFF